MCIEHRLSLHTIPAHTHTQTYQSVHPPLHPYTRVTPLHTRAPRPPSPATRMRARDRRLGKSCSLQPCSYLKRSIAGKGTKAKPAINSHLPPSFSCPPASRPCLSSPSSGPQQPGQGCSPPPTPPPLERGGGFGAPEATWPSTDLWNRPGALGLDGCRDSGVPICTQSWEHVPSSEGRRPPWATPAASAEQQGWQMQGKEGESAQPQPRLLRALSFQPGQAFPARLPWVGS